MFFDKKAKLDADDLFTIMTEEITPFQFRRHMKQFRNNDNFPEKVPFSRRKGRTTRQADQAIQQLFKKGYVRIKDHHGTHEATDILFNIIHKRLKNEHRHILDDLNINKRDNTIVFKYLYENAE